MIFWNIGNVFGFRDSQLKVFFISLTLCGHSKYAWGHIQSQQQTKLKDDLKVAVYRCTFMLKIKRRLITEWQMWLETKPKLNEQQWKWKQKKKSRNILSQVAPSWLYVYISSHHFPLSHEMLFVCVYCTCVVKGILPVTSIVSFFSIYICKGGGFLGGGCW